MFSFHTHEIQATIHKIDSDFWEENLEKIYSTVVLKHQTCLGLVSNTFKSTPNDKVGSFSENTNFLFKTKIDPTKHDLLILIDKDKFNEYMNNRSKIEITEDYVIRDYHVNKHHYCC